MSLNLMSLIGVGRVGLRPNSDDVTNFTLSVAIATLGTSNVRPKKMWIYSK